MATKATTPVDKHVGSRVRMRRLIMSLSQTELANPLGITFQQLQKYENGTNQIGAGRIQQIANLLTVLVAFFFEGSPTSAAVGASINDAPSSAFIDDFLSSSEGLAIAGAFSRIKEPKLRRRIVDLVLGNRPDTSMIQLPDGRWVVADNLGMPASAPALERFTKQMCAVMPQIDEAKRALIRATSVEDEQDRKR